MAGYTRQSIADIVNGLDITAPPLTAEFNQLDAAFNSTTGHAHDGSPGNGPKINLSTSVQGYLPAASGGLGGLNKTDAIVAPVTTNDNLQGYAPGSIWINVTNGRVYRCLGNATNAAVWREEVQVLSGNQITPVATNTVDLGTSAIRFKDAYLATANTSGAAAIGGTLTVTGNATLNGTTSVAAITASGTATLGTTIITGGTINGATVGATTASTVRGTTITATTGFSGPLTGAVTGNVTGDVNGDVTGNLTGNVTAAIGTSTFNDVTVNGSLNMNAVSAGTVTGLSTPVNATDAATKSYVDTSISNLVGAAPAALNTLSELATALGNDAAFSTTVTNSIGTKLNKAGDTMTGALAMGTNKITGLGTPTATTDATTKTYVDSADALKLNLAGGTMTGAIAMGNNKITGLGTPTLAGDAVPKSYADSILGSATAATDAATAATAAADAATAAAASINLSSIAITGGSITGITDLAIADGGTGASTAANARTNLGLGTLATQASTAVAITGGTITGITDLAIADGGTGSSTALGARSNLGLDTMSTQAATAVTVTGGTINGTTVGATTAAAGTFTVSTAATSRLTATPDITLVGTTHALQIGPSTAANLTFDTADIQGRNNGAASPVLVNALGGNVTLGSDASMVSVPGTISLVSGAINGTVIGSTSASTGAFTTGTMTTGNITTAVLGLGTALLPSATFTGDTNTGMWSPAADTLAFSTAGSERLRLTSAGNLTVDGTTFNVDATNNRVGVGTLTPTTALDVAGTVNATALSLSGSAVTSTAAELNILDGVTSTAAELNILDGVTSTAAELNLLDGASTTLAAPFLANPQNYIDPDNRVINGDFGFWQRATTITGDGFAADRWKNSSVGGTVTQSRSIITPGAMIGSNALQYALAHTVSGQTLTSHRALTSHKIESALSYSGETITVLGWAYRASGAGNMAVSFRQVHDGGGNFNNPVATVTLSGSYQPFAVVMNIPAVTGFTINGNDYLELEFWTSAGSDFAPSGVTIGLQTISTRLWGVHIKRGTHTTSSIDMYRPRLAQDELRLCQRFYEVGDVGSDGGVATKYGSAGAQGFNGVHSFKVNKRAAPAVAFGGTATLENCTNLVAASVGFPTRGFTSRATITATGSYRAYSGTWSADAEFI